MPRDIWTSNGRNAAPVEIRDGYYLLTCLNDDEEVDNWRLLKVATQPAYASFAAGRQIVSLHGLRGDRVRRDSEGFVSFAFADGSGIFVWNKNRGTPERASEEEKIVRCLWSLLKNSNDSPYWSKGYDATFYPTLDDVREVVELEP
jgi:hypothetical protein